MPRLEIPITGGFYVSRSLPISAQTAINCYVHINEGGGLAKESLFGTPGANQLATAGNSLFANRGAIVMNGIPFFVQGADLFRLDRTVSGAGVESFALLSLGTVGGSGRVSLAHNGNEVCVLIPGGDGFIWDSGASTFTKIVDADFRANGEPQHVVFIDGFFLFTTDTKKFIISALNDGLVYDALDFGTAEADPDDIVAPIVMDNQLYITGETTIELFRNAAPQTGAAFPFVRVEGGVTSAGVYAPFSLIRSRSNFFFIGGDKDDEPRIFIYGGGRAAPISTDAIDAQLEALTDTELQNVFAWTYTQNGTTFIGWTLPGICLVYDTKSGRWHERQSFAIDDEGLAATFRWRANSVVRAYARILVGDSIDGRVGEIDLDCLDEYGNEILRSFTTLPFSNLGLPLFVSEIELTVESGVGNTADPEPLISMDRSLDGKTFTPRRERKIGRKGLYKNRCIWRRNGRAARFEIFRFSMSAKVRCVFIKLEANIK